MIGCGDVTEKKSAPSFNKISGSSLLGVTSRSGSKAAAYAKRRGIPNVYHSPDELIDDQEINAVYVATPPSSHAKYAIMAMRAGKPVYLEKPMAKDYLECIEINRVSEETGVPLFVAYYRRSMEYFLKVKELLHNRSIGNILTMQSSLYVPARPEDLDRKNLPWRVIPEISGGGYFYDMACHELDILCYYFGKVGSVKGWCANMGGLYPPEDTVSASLVFTSGLLYSGSWCFVASPEAASDVIEIIGEKGRIRFSCFQFSPIELETPSGRQTYPIDPPEHVQLPMIKSVVEELQGLGMSPSKGNSAAHVNWIMDEILAQ
jgi:predicted dehydrogenase